MYMQNGSSVSYATVKLGKFEFFPNTTVIYLGPSTVRPAAMMARTCMSLVVIFIF
jgi:hypothetical protein